MDFQRCVAVGGGKYNMLYGRDEMALSALAMGAAAAVSSTIGYSPTLPPTLANIEIFRRVDLFCEGTISYDGCRQRLLLARGRPERDKHDD